MPTDPTEAARNTKLAMLAKTIEEACKLIAEGWTLACEFDGAKIFKKRK